MIRRNFMFAGLAILVSTLPAVAFEPYSKAAFDAALASGKPLVVHVHADWCPTCKAQAPVLGAMEKDELKNAKVIRVDFDKDEDFTKAFGVRQQSTVIVFNHGKETTRFGGVTDGTKFRQLVVAGLH